MEILNIKINKVIYINLEEATERKESCLKILENIFDKDKIIRFNAIKDRYLGATKSHIGCLELAIQNNWNNILIVEDDLSIYNENNNLKSLNTLYKLLNKNFDVIVLGGTNIIYNPWNNNLYRCSSGTSYIVNKSYYLKLKNHYQEGLYKLIHIKLPKKMNNKYIFDAYWNILQKKDNWKIIYPPIFYQKNNYSYVNDKIMSHEYAFFKVNLTYFYPFLLKYYKFKKYNFDYLFNKIYIINFNCIIKNLIKIIMLFLLIKYKLLWILLLILIPLDLFKKIYKIL